MTGQQLKNSILQMAVQGKLVPQDPNDEPASVLIERIREEKERLIKEKKIKKEKNPSFIFRGADNLPYEKVGKNEPICIADEVPFDIPDSWEWVRLIEVCEYIQRGKSPKYSTKKKYPVVAQKCNQWDGFSIEKAKFIEPDSLQSYGEERILQENDLMWNSTGLGTLGRIAIYKSVLNPYELAVADSHVTVIRPFKAYVLPEYLYYYFANPSVQNVIEDKADGTTKQKELATATIKEYLVPIPPLNEQKRILKKLEEVLPIVEKYRRVYDTAQSLQDSFPDRLKKSILLQAVQGKLVPQDPSDESAEILLERIRTEKQRLIKEGKIKKDKHESIIFRRDNSHYEKRGSDVVCIDEEIPFEIPAGWNWSRLGTCLDVRDGTHDTPRYVAEGVPLVTSKNLSNGKIDFTTAKLISREDSQVINQRSNVDSGDIMYAMIGSIGNPVLYQGNKEFSIKNMALFKRIPNGMDMEYVYWFLVLVQEDMKKAASGGVQSFVSLGYLRNYLIPVPPVAEQKRIYSTIGQIMPLLAGL